MVIGYSELHYLPAFFASLDEFTKPIEAVKRSSQIGATAMVRCFWNKMSR